MMTRTILFLAVFCTSGLALQVKHDTKTIDKPAIPHGSGTGDDAPAKDKPTSPLKSPAALKSAKLTPSGKDEPSAWGRIVQHIGEMHWGLQVVAQLLILIKI